MTVATIDVDCTELRAGNAERLVDRLAAGPADRIALLAGTEDSAWPARPGTTAWWERLLIQRNFGKSTVTPGSPCRLQRDADGQLTRHPVLFDRLPPDLIAQFPLATLLHERDLHMDMLREAGPRSDAHLARYRWASTFVRSGMTVVDAACGLGYGSAIVADTAGPARVVALDLSAYAIAYARCAWTERRPQVEFVRQDVATIPIEDGAADVVVSFETIEHLEDPTPFLLEVRRVLRPGGTFVGSVPNLWVDASGKDPSPYHFHVFDRERLLRILAPHVEVRDLWQQNAAHDVDERLVLPRFHQVGLDGAGIIGKPEWLIFVAHAR